jgi:hypothetical protein
LNGEEGDGPMTNVLGDGIEIAWVKWKKDCLNRIQLRAKKNSKRRQTEKLFLVNFGPIQNVFSAGKFAENLGGSLGKTKFCLEMN